MRQTLLFQQVTKDSHVFKRVLSFAWKAVLASFFLPSLQKWALAMWNPAAAYVQRLPLSLFIRINSLFPFTSLHMHDVGTIWPRNGQGQPSLEDILKECPKALGSPAPCFTCIYTKDFIIISDTSRQIFRTQVFKIFEWWREVLQKENRPSYRYVLII